jgi:dipeptidyl aminopeptidase/acylaminoacyl peptidase
MIMRRLGRPRGCHREGRGKGPGGGATARLTKAATATAAAAACLAICWPAVSAGRAAVAAPLTGAAAAGTSSSTPAAASRGSGEALALQAIEDALFSTRTFDQAAISPDGRQVAWVENLPGRAAAAADDRAIFVARLAAAEAAAGRSAGGGEVSATASSPPRRLTAAAGRWVHEERAVTWSPDSRQLAFLSDAEEPGQLQLYVATPADGAAAGGTARRLTRVRGFLAAPAWSPDGRTIAVLFTENATRQAGPLAAETPESGEIVEAVTEQRLALVDVATGTLRQLSPPDMYVYEYDWSPDGRRFAAIAAHGNGDNNWYIAELYTLDAAAGAMTSIHKPSRQIACPRWSPDGQRIAFIAGLMSDEEAVGNDIFSIAAAGGGLRELTPRMRASASWLQWARQGEELLFAEYVDGETGVAAVRPETGEIRTLWRGGESASAQDQALTLSMAADGRTMAVIRSSFSRPPEVWAGAAGEWRQVTTRNAGRAPLWGEAKSIHWTSDGYDIQGWLVAPPGIASAAGPTLPLVVNVHGGPAAMAPARWPRPGDRAMALAALGYYVLFPNPRGSFGWGEDFLRANVKDLGYGDLRDILAGVDAAARLAPIDRGRVGITGWSYGGYMSMWAVTQTDRFKAAVIGAGLANFQSYYGENKIDQWLIPYFGASVYDDPAIYARSSPITFIKNVKTPSLVLVGDRDGECPPPQSYEFWHALKTLGVPTRLVVYENEGHHFTNPAHRRDLIERTVRWFDDHLR